MVAPAVNLQTLADQVLLQHFSPPAVLVNTTGDILYISGLTGKYLEPAAGKTNWNIFAMAREGLRLELGSAFQKALRQKEAVTVKGVKIGTNGGSQNIDLTVQTLAEPEALRGMVMIIFTDVAPPRRPSQGAAHPHRPAAPMSLNWSCNCSTSTKPCRPPERRCNRLRKSSNPPTWSCNPPTKSSSPPTKN